MKKILLIISTILLSTTVLVGHTSAQQSGFGDSSLVQGYTVPGTTNVNQSNGDKILDVVKVTVNRVLGILSLIALILCLYGGFLMLTAAGDESKVKTGTKVLKHAAIGLAIIGLSRLIISFVFRLIKKFTTEAGAGA